jgi:acyl-coenzyme A thioesterase PaaI-like protein
VPTDTPRRRNILRELGLSVETVDDEVRGHAEVVPPMWAPGTESLRLSVLATWADIVLGHLVARAVERIPVTLALDVHVFEPVSGCATVASVARVAKTGQSIVACTIDFTNATGRRLGFGHGLLMAAQDPRLELPPGSVPSQRFAAGLATLTEPFASRAGCERVDRGVASLPCQRHVLTGAKSLNAGVAALVVEEAALSADSDAHPIASMTLRYLRPIRTGPAVARAQVEAGLGSIEVHDVGTNQLAVLATTRFFGS